MLQPTATATGRTAREAARNVARNLAANMVRSIRPEACIHRRGRLMGNLTRLCDLALLRLPPEGAAIRYVPSGLTGRAPGFLILEGRPNEFGRAPARARPDRGFRHAEEGRLSPRGPPLNRRQYFRTRGAGAGAGGTPKA